MIKWIICDMDGTLLKDNHNLPADFPEIMKGLKQAGIIFSPASGRQLATLQEMFQVYGEDLMYISDNGTYVYQNSRELFSATLPGDLVKEILDAVAKLPQVYPIVSCKGVAYYNTKNPRLIKELEIYYKSNKYVESFADIDYDKVIKIALCDPIGDNAREHIFNPLKEKYGNNPNMQLVLSGNIWVDVNPAGINKGAAIKQLQKTLQIKPEECMAFGDYLNDLEMLQAVKYSYAMANAIPEIKAVANYEAPSNEQEGVTKIIRQLLNNGGQPIA